MKPVRFILYLSTVAIAALLFDWGFAWLFGYIHTTYEQLGERDFILLCLISCLGAGFIFFHLIIISLGKSIYKNITIANFKAFCALIMLGGNLLYGLYRIWIGMPFPYTAGAVLLNLIFSVIIADFSYRLLPIYETEKEKKAPSRFVVTDINDEEFASLRAIYGTRISRANAITKYNLLLNY